jgi:hypothetical protein
MVPRRSIRRHDDEEAWDCDGDGEYSYDAREPCGFVALQFIKKISMVMYRALTEFTIIVHLLFILFVVGGGFFARRWWWLTTIHLASVAWAFYAELAPGVVCPLTALENHFAERAGIATYKEDFVTRYLVPIIYPDQLGPALQYFLVGAVLVINVAAYTTRRKKLT